MLRSGYLFLALLVLPVAAMVTPASVARAAATPAVVLVNQPAGSVCISKTFTVGVWYQQSGGSRAYRLDVYNPRGMRVLHKRGTAPASAWKFWKVRAKLAGRYRTVYWTHPAGSRKWSAYHARTRAHHC
ncbi:MAG TPA: hypothetical protein VKB62_08200 [Streptosporangiaceae bacterium]|nr:hypothetical protein [Streptosporangiaceae bacterium]